MSCLVFILKNLCLGLLTFQPGTCALSVQYQSLVCKTIRVPDCLLFFYFLLVFKIIVLCSSPTRWLCFCSFGKSIRWEGYLHFFTFLNQVVYKIKGKGAVDPDSGYADDSHILEVRPVWSFISTVSVTVLCTGHDLQTLFFEMVFEMTSYAFWCELNLCAKLYLYVCMQGQKRNRSWIQIMRILNTELLNGLNECAPKLEPLQCHVKQDPTGDEFLHHSYVYITAMYASQLCMHHSSVYIHIWHDTQTLTYTAWMYAQKGKNVYSATLNKTDIEHDKNSYYILQVCVCVCACVTYIHRYIHTCLCVYMHTRIQYMHTHTYMNWHTTYRCVHICIHEWTYTTCRLSSLTRERRTCSRLRDNWWLMSHVLHNVHMFVCMHGNSYIYIYIYIHTYTHTHIYIYIYPYIICTYIHTHTHMYTHTSIARTYKHMHTLLGRSSSPIPARRHISGGVGDALVHPLEEPSSRPWTKR